MFRRPEKLTWIHLLYPNEIFHLPYIPELVARKLSGLEKSILANESVEGFRKEYERLVRVLEEAGRSTELPETTAIKPALDDLLLCIRLNQVG
jgi:uncharacterized protein